MTDIPQWAIDRVVELVNNDGSNYKAARFATEEHCLGYSIGKVFARYVAAHEEAPVDPLEEAFTASIENARADGADDEAAGHHQAAFHYLRAHLAKHGLKIVEAE